MRLKSRLLAPAFAASALLAAEPNKSPLLQMQELSDASTADSEHAVLIHKTRDRSRTAKEVSNGGLMAQVQGRKIASNQNAPSYTGLPDLARFRTNRSDRFLVDVQYISGGHPFKGRLAFQPHQGAHVHWDNSTNAWPKGGGAVSNYPAIYAVADGYVDRIDYSFKVGGNDRYGVSIAFAKDKGTVYSFCYGIEPMIPEPAPDLYKRFIVVSEGQRVKKGDILAYMYLPPGARGGSHIHFHIQAHNGGGFLAPAIFTDEVVASFHAHWDGFGRDGAASMPACMGYLLDADENPFRTGAMDVLR